MVSLNCKGRLVFFNHPIVMGIINVTPDSFYSESRVLLKDQILRIAGKMLKEGASILDIGGMSSRPGATEISVVEEMRRVIPAIEYICREFPEALISIDSFMPEVVKVSLETGASIINDIGVGPSEEIVKIAVLEKAPYICMHSRGNPKTMQTMIQYEDVTTDILDFMISRKARFTKLGLIDMIIDPGFGFAKNIQQNFKLLRDLRVFRSLELPVLVGLSRKSSIYKTLQIDVADSLNGSTVMHTLALENGADILRVHDVREANEAIRLWMSYRNA